MDPPAGFWTDPIADRLKRRNIAGDFRLVRDTLEDIEPLDLSGGQTFQDLAECKFAIPKTMEDAVVTVQELRRVTRVHEHCQQQLSRPNTRLSDATMAVIQETRDRLLQCLFANTPLVKIPHKFSYEWQDRRIKLEPKMHYAVLQMTHMLSMDRQIYNRLAGYGPASELFAPLRERALFNPHHPQCPFFQYRPVDLYFLIQFIEARWLYISFVPDRLLDLFDILLMRLSQLATVPQPEESFIGLERYRRMVGSGVCVVSEVLLEDFFWALMPMYYQTLLREKFEKYKTKLPFQITEEQSEQLKQRLSDITKENNTVALQGNFQTAFMEQCLRPSELERYVRDNPGRETLRSSVISAQRSAEIRNSISEKLAPLPWDIHDKALLASNELDMLFLMMLDIKINNMSREKNFCWLQNTVFFRIHILEESDPVQWVRDMRRPIIVQAFNGFSLFHADKFYDYMDAGAAVIHWILIILTEFNGTLSRTKLKDLHTFVPPELKAQLGLRF